LPVRETERHVRLAEDYRSGGADTLDRGCIFHRVEVPECRHAPGRRQAGDVEGLLDGDWNS
jgi:hypothetical protein